MVQHATTRKEHASKHPAREKILTWLRKEPGLTCSQIQARLGCSKGTVQYHVRILESAALVKSTVTGRRRRLFMADMPSDRVNALAAMSRGRTPVLVKRILASPGVAQHQLTGDLGMTRKILRRYVDRLIAQDLIHEERDTGTCRYFATETLGSLLDEAGIPSPTSREPPAEAQVDVIEQRDDADAPQPMERIT